MLNLKKTAGALAVLASSVGFAGTMGPVCTPGNVTVPCESTAFDVAIHALYLKPSYTGAFAYPANSAGDSLYHDFDHDYQWGFRLEGSYHFNTGNDLTVNWTYWSHDYFVNPDNVNSWDWKPKFNQVNVEMGQHVDFGEMKNIRFHGGVQYARVDYTNHWAGSVPQIPGNDVVNVQDASKFNGFGPRAGVDMSYDFGNGFQLYANSATALLVGDGDFNVSAGAAGAFTVSGGSHSRVVPELEAKLGAKYTYAMASGDLTGDIGYMWQNYFNAQHVTTLESDFGVHGLYFGLKWVGNVA
jgi:hypothetical protein